MGSIEWKGAKWESLAGSLTIAELLTTLKGFGPMELLRFEVPGRFKGELNLWLTEDGVKEVTLYHLEVCGEKCAGMGREALRWLRQIFKGTISVEFADPPDPVTGFYPSAPFWFKMYREGLIDAVDCENYRLPPHATSEQIQQVGQLIESVLGKRPKAP
ncbi:MAG TPA: hypothetical protein VEF34_16070 [Syntrophobacteraceae bacterium]|nr:hypothetical protein [Syntrophobacteraceae bacterium]